MRLTCRWLAILTVSLGTVPTAARAQLDDLTMHGYLTQGFAKATDAPIYGITEAGTTDYRAMALQFRYATSGTTALVFQFSHRRLGSSLIQATEPDVALDWSFFQARWEGFGIRVGKVPMPRGFFNEVRDVGVLFPFFRASKAFYSEGVETVDGVSVKRAFDFGNSGFSLDGSVYAGEFDILIEIAAENGLELFDNRITRTLGAHVQLHTPVPGLRFSADYIPQGQRVSGDRDFRLWTASGEYSQDRYFARGEYEVAYFKERSTGDRAQDYTAWYGQAGVRITERLWLNGQYEFNHIELFDLLPSPPLPSPDLAYDNIKDFAFSLSYEFTPLLVLKGEYHIFEGHQFDVPTPPLDLTTGEPLPAGKTEYFVISLSAAF